MDLRREWASLSEGARCGLEQLGCTCDDPHLLEGLVAAIKDCVTLRQQLGEGAEDGDAEALWRVAGAAAAPARDRRDKLQRRPVTERVAAGDAARCCWTDAASTAGAAWAKGAAAPAEKPILEVWRTRRKRALAAAVTTKAREEVEKKERDRWTEQLQIIL